MKELCKNQYDYKKINRKKIQKFIIYKLKKINNRCLTIEDHT